MNKYQNSKIYKIYSDLGDKIYIGCTTKQYLSQRMASHKYNYAYFKKCIKDNYKGLPTELWTENTTFF